MTIARDIITDAFRKIGVVAADEPMDADQAASGVRALNRYLGSLQNRGIEFYLDVTVDITLTTAASYPVTSTPKRIESARVLKDGVETVMLEIMRNDYDTLPVKDTEGFPTQFYYDRTQAGGVIYIWPLLAAPAGEILRMTVEAQVAQAVDINSNIVLPIEWEEAVVYGLADRLADDHDLPAERVRTRAEQELRMALSRDREGSIFFHEGYGAYP